MRYLITGATGFLGSHVAEVCVQRGRSVVAPVRATSDTRFLESLGPLVTLMRGDLSDAAFLRQALSDVDVVVHCAGKVGDWGSADEYRPVNVEGTRTLLEACKGQALTRFIHVSSLGVYAAKDHYGTDETAPLPRKHRRGYSQSKMEAELLALQYYREYGVPVVALRPGLVYGPRDQAVVPALIEGLRKKRVRYPGSRGRGAMNSIYVRNFVDAIFLAVERDEAVGQAYNLTDGEYVSKRRFVEAVADAMALPRPWRCPPYWICWLVAWCCETWCKLRGAKEAPYFNLTKLKFLGLNLDFSIEKARRELGYNPRVPFDEAMYETMAWYKNQQPAGATP